MLKNKLEGKKKYLGLLNKKLEKNKKESQSREEHEKMDGKKSLQEQKQYLSNKNIKWPPPKHEQTECQQHQ